MKNMKVARGTARAKRRAVSTETPPSAIAQRAMLADLARLNHKLKVQLFHKAATGKFARHSPFA